MLIPTRKSGFRIEGEARDIETIKTRKGNRLLIGRNNDSIQIFGSD